VALVPIFYVEIETFFENRANKKANKIGSTNNAE